MRNSYKNKYPGRIINKICFTSLNIYNTGVKFTDRVLDIGGGNGVLASFLKKNGFKDVTCIDLFCEKPLVNNIKYYQCELTDLPDEQYDFIMMNCSFEHMDNPHEILEKTRRVLSDNGVCLIKIPVIGKNEAWRLYGVNWVNLDAPRHCFLYSPEGMYSLCKQHGLRVEKVMFHSAYDFLYQSQMYAETELSLCEIQDLFSKVNRKERKRLYRKGRRLDAEGKGDHAWFYIKKDDVI